MRANLPDPCFIFLYITFDTTEEKLEYSGVVLYDSFMGKSVYLIFGEGYLADIRAKKLVTELVPEGEKEFGLDVIEGGVGSADEALAAILQCIESLQTLGFFGTGRTVWLKGANFLADNKIGKTKDVKARVNELAGLIKDCAFHDAKLIITSDKVDKRFALYKACKEVGNVIEDKAADKTAAGRKRAVEISIHAAQRRGLKLPASIAQVFIDRVGHDARQIVNEMDKLALYVQGKNVTREDLHAIVSATNEALIWDLADSFGRRKMKECLQVLRQLIFQKISPVGLIIGLEKRVQDLLVIKEALEQGWLMKGDRGCSWRSIPENIAECMANDLASDPRKLHPYRLMLLSGQASLYRFEELLFCRDVLERCHTRMVSSGLPQELLLELVLIEMIGGRSSQAVCRLTL